MRGFLLATLLLAACAGSGARREPGPPYSSAQLLDLFVRWREAERRRDAELARDALVYGNSADRAFHERELEYLHGLPAGPICTAVELRLAGHPADMGPGDYCFLEPVAGQYRTALVTVVRTRSGPRIRYRRPDVSEQERGSLPATQVERLALERRIDWWRGLGTRELASEVERTRRMLRYQIAAQRLAQREGLALPPFDPDPARILADLEGLEPEQARTQILALLGAKS